MIDQEYVGMASLGLDLRLLLVTFTGSGRGDAINGPDGSARSGRSRI